MDVRSFEQKRIRRGKTEKDAKAGCARRRRDNQIERHNWNNESRSAAHARHTCPPFPVHTLGGKGNSSKELKVIRGRGLTTKYRQPA